MRFHRFLQTDESPGSASGQSKVLIEVKGGQVKPLANMVHLPDHRIEPGDILMLTITLPEELESAVIDAARRSGLSVNDYVSAVFADALSLEIDRARLDSYLSGTQGVSHKRAQAWLENLAAGNR